MPVTTNLKRSFVVWNALYLVITLGLGIWGAYDYWVTIPNLEIAADRYEALLLEKTELEATATSTGPLTGETLARYTEIETLITDEFDNTAPQRPAAYDRPLNFWAYFVGCGILGAPWFAWKLLTQKRRGPRLEEDGSLVNGDEQFSAEQITGIDMSRWMAKSTAKVMIDGREEPILLDDYVYQDSYKIVGHLAHRFDPENWTEEAKPAKNDDSESTEANAEGDAAEASEDDHAES